MSCQEAVSSILIAPCRLTLTSRLVVVSGVDFSGQDDSVYGGRQDTPRARVFVGRLPELDALAAVLAAARAGEPQVVLLEGEAGIGKSSLILEFLGRQPEVPAIVASGEAAEAVLSYGVVRQLTAAVLPGALAGLELLSRGPRADADPLAVGVELLALISALQGNQAAAVVVEDLQWADLPSARALLFACRRLAADRLLMILSCRPEGTSHLGDGWARFTSGDRRASRITLGGLNAGDLGVLCRRLGRPQLPDRALRRLAEHTGGNPLLARAVLAELTDDALTATDGSFRAPRSLAGLILPRLAALPRPARDLVVAAAVLGDQCTLADVSALAGTADPAAALDEAQRAGFLTERSTLSGRAVSFAHSLIRQAVYDDLGAERRRRLHLRAAAFVGDPAALGHRAAAAAGPDLTLAADLSTAATAAVDAGKLLLAARYLQRAGAVTERGPARDERVLSAFELLVRAADVSAADATRPVIEQLPASTRRDTALGQLALLSARPWDADVLLRAAWDARDQAGHGDRGGQAALWLGQLLGMSGSFTEGELWLDRALGSGTGSEPWYDAARCIRSFAFALSGDTSQALALFRDLPGPPARVPASRTDALAYRGVARLCAGDLHTAAGDLALAVHRVSTGLQVRFPGPPLAFLTEAEFRLGRWDDAQGHAELAFSLARDADRDYDLAFVRSMAVPVSACRGDWAAADAHAQAAEDAARIFGGLALIFAASARAILGFARSDPQEALRGAALALAVPQADQVDCPAALWWRPAQIWALIRAGELDEAAAVLAAFESRAAARGEPGGLIHAACLRGTLAMARGDPGQAGQVLQAGRRAAHGVPLPFHRAVLDLQHGRCLALLHQRGAAIDAVRAAHDLFVGLRAHPFIRASESELDALGLRPRPDGDPGLPGLTAQELRVARLVASGLSNRQAAAQLYLSPKTVEYHLAHAYTKLGVHSRHQLTALIRGQGGRGSPA
jgi:DNA-binding CsgD family transcriptional regulator